MPRLPILALPLLALWAGAAHAQDGETCRNGLFPNEPPFTAAQVTGTGRVYFLDDTDGCPDRGPACRSRGYVVAGDTVLVNRTHGRYACAFYPGKGGGTAGWIEAARLAGLPVDAEPPQSAWLGGWAQGDNPAIRFFEDEDGQLRVVGEAFWPGRQPTRMYPSIHVGEIAGPVARKGNTGAYQDDNLCEITFTLVGDLLVGGDNGQCGGANVSFSAVYRREKA